MITGETVTYCAIVKRHSILYLKDGFLSVVEKHEDGHLEGGDLQDVLPGVGACYLGASHSHL